MLTLCHLLCRCTPLFKHYVGNEDVQESLFYTHSHLCNRVTNLCDGRGACNLPTVQHTCGWRDCLTIVQMNQMTQKAFFAAAISDKKRQRALSLCYAQEEVSDLFNTQADIGEDFATAKTNLNAY